MTRHLWNRIDPPFECVRCGESSDRRPGRAAPPPCLPDGMCGDDLVARVKTYRAREAAIRLTQRKKAQRGSMNDQAGHCPECGRKASKKSVQQMRCNYADCGADWEVEG